MTIFMNIILWVASTIIVLAMFGLLMWLLVMLFNLVDSDHKRNVNDKQSKE